MVELVFVIVILGILAAVAVPRLSVSRDDAQIAKGRSNIASIRSSIISERQSRLIRGQNNYISKLHSGGTGNFDTLFDSNGTGANDATLLMYGVNTENNTDGQWDDTVSTANGVWIYTFRIMNTNVDFNYSNANGTFDCNHNLEACRWLTE